MGLDNDFEKHRPPPGATLVSDDAEIMVEMLRTARLTWEERVREARERYGA